MRTIILLITITFSLSSCCTEANYQHILDSRLGMSENELIEQIGNPTSVYVTPEKISLEYKETSDIYCNDFGCGTNWCTTQYMVKDGKVVRYSYKGNNCCAYK